MIGKLTGQLAGGGSEGMVLLDVGGVGYAVRTPLLALASLSLTPGAEVSLYIHTAVREDAIDLYGFLMEEDLRFFKQLMSVSGIGPKTALSILNVAEVPALKRSIAQGDIGALTKVFGVGKKSAERIILELREKLAEEFHGTGTPSPLGSDTDVMEALLSLGYSTGEARNALKAISPTLEDTKSRVAAALKHLGSNAHIH